MDRRTKEYRDKAREDGRFVLPKAVEQFASLIFEAGFRSTPDHSYWVPTSQIHGEVRDRFPDAPVLTPKQLGDAIRAAEPEAVRVLRRPLRGHTPVRGFSGITGPGGCRTKVAGE